MAVVLSTLAACFTADFELNIYLKTVGTTFGYQLVQGLILYIFAFKMEEETATSSTSGFTESISRKYQYVMDKSSPHILYRWIIFAVVFALYLTRVYFLNGWFIVTYGLGIYMLNQLIGFLSPQVRALNAR